MNDEAKSQRTVLVCSRCGRVVERLLTPPVRPMSSRRPEAEGGLVCEVCLGDLEREYLQDESTKLPPSTEV